MIIYLSISSRPDLDFIANVQHPSTLNILASFEYKNSMKRWLPKDCKNFLADSGAFTAMNAGKPIDNKYIDNYIKWIMDNDIDHFMEMDLDEIIGYEKTLQIRQVIERETGKPTIPCWHLERGEQGWKQMCDQYNYVAISLSRMTKTSKWLQRYNFRPLEFFLGEAAKKKCRVHALGCNDFSLLKKYHFYSADSSTHTAGNRFGRVYVFKDGKIQDINKTRTHRIDKNAADKQNIKTMIQVMEYAEKHL